MLKIKTGRITAAFLALCMLISAFVLSSCESIGSVGSKPGQNAMTYVGEDGKSLGSVDKSFMYFWISIQKSMYSSVADSYENGWDQVVDEQNGTTLNDLLMTESTESAKKLLAIEYLHDDVYDIGLADEQKDSIDSQVDKLAENYGSREALENKLSEFGASIETLRRYYELRLKQSDLFSYFYDENGKFVVSEDAKKAYFSEKYSIVNHIFFNTAGTQKEDGTTVSLPDEQKAQKKQTSEEVYSMIKNGLGDFDALKTQYDEDTYATQYYPYGFFVTNDSSFPTEFTTAAMNLAVGEITYVETPGTGYHILKKLPMDQNLYSVYGNVYESISTNLETDDFNARIAEYTANVTQDDAIMGEFDPALIPVFALN